MALQSTILAEVHTLVAEGVREIHFPGADRTIAYGKEFTGSAQGHRLHLLRMAHGILDLYGAHRFLTSHPSWMTDELLDVVAEYRRSCHILKIPVRAGDVVLGECTAWLCLLMIIATGGKDPCSLG